MKIKNKSCYAVMVLMLSGALLFTGLTGCKSKEAQFLIDGLQEAKAEVDAEESEKKTTSDENEKKSDTADAQNDKSSSQKSETDSLESKKSGSDNAETGSVGVYDSGDENNSDAGTEVLTDVQMQQEMIYVDVCGAVANPGVFQLEAGSRVFQAIEAAGGYLPEAVPNCVNRAGVLTDGQQLYILTQQEMEQQGLNAAEMANASGGQTAGDAGTGVTAEVAFAGQQDNKININTADETQLTTLTGIGATRAQAIIAYRQENGPFAAIEEIMNVQGIKEGTFAKIKDEIVVG